MRVVLIKNVEKLGSRGDVCDVAEGYARNFLFARKFAVSATPTALAEAEQWRKEREHAAELDLGRAEDITRRLDGFELEFTEKANEGGTLFAAVTRAKIAEKLKTKGFALTEKNIILEHPIKEVGEYEVTIALPHGLEARIRVIVNAV